MLVNEIFDFLVVNGLVLFLDEFILLVKEDILMVVLECFLLYIFISFIVC